MGVLRWCCVTKTCACFLDSLGFSDFLGTSDLVSQNLTFSKYEVLAFEIIDSEFLGSVSLDSKLVDGRVAGHLGAAVGLKTLSIYVCICPHFGM